MALVHVKDRRLHAELAQQANPADAQQNFLHDAHGVVAAINARGQIAEMLGVFRAVGIEQIHRHAPDVHAPGLKEDAVHVNFHVAYERLAVGIQHGFERHIFRIHQIVEFGLPVVRVNGLLEIAFAVKQTDADKAKSEVAGGFGVVAGQDAEAARRNRQRLVKAKFGGKIRDGILEQLRRVHLSPGVFAGEIVLEIMQYRAGALLKVGVLQAHAQLVFRDFAQNGGGVVIKVLPGCAARVPEINPAPPGPSSTTNCGTICSSRPPARSIPRLREVSLSYVFGL